MEVGSRLQRFASRPVPHFFATVLHARPGHAWFSFVRRFLLAALLAASSFSAQACVGILETACHRLDQIWTEGNNDLYVSGWAWHNRSKYPASRIRSFNEKTWGGGLGRSFYDEDGDWHGLYAMAFRDSYRKVEPVAGYAFMKIGNLSENFKLGAGYTVFVTARSEFRNYMPFPGILPLVGAGYRNSMLYATYIPRIRDNGNVLFVFGRLQF